MIRPCGPLGLVWWWEWGHVLLKVIITFSAIKNYGSTCCILSYVAVLLDVFSSALYVLLAPFYGSGFRQCLAHVLMEVVPLSSKAHASSLMDGGGREWSCIPKKSLEKVQQLVNTGHVDR